MLTARYLAAFHEDMRALGVAPPDVEPRVTEHLPQIVALIERLIAAGHAYEAEGHVLFSVPSFAEYGQLSGRDPDDMLAGARVEVAPYKRDPGDFVLWKPSDAATSSAGRARGAAAARAGTSSARRWPRRTSARRSTSTAAASTSCSRTTRTRSRRAPARTAASASRATGCTTASCRSDGEKMSKSLGNVRLVRDLLAEHGGETVRLALLTAHYRQPLDWTDQLVVESRQKLDRMYGALRDAGVSGTLTRRAGGAAARRRCSRRSRTI